MKYRIVILLLVTLGLLAACNTTQPVGFIATPGYVDAQIAASEEAMRLEYESLLVQKDREIARLQRELEDQRVVADELAGLADLIRDVDASNRELQELASEVEVRLQDIPNETLEILVEILSRHLEGQTEPRIE
jgi:hypothetical protein